MMEGASILCFAHDWGGDPTSKTHIMKILARRNRVLWVNSIAMRRPAASGRDLRRLFDKVAKGLRGCQEVEPNLFVTNPLVIPLPGWNVADRLNAGILSATLRRLCRRRGLEDPILWSFLPNVGRLLGRLGERLAIYHCVDEYSAFTGVSRDAIARLERDFVRRADLVLTSSAQLASERVGLNPNTHFVSHGVDLAHFATALDGGIEIPAELRALPRPVIGFFGLLADWVDLDLVRDIALGRPDWSFALVGKQATGTGALRGLPNVHLLGQKPYALLPAYCRGFDVGIIPFRTSDLTLRANPLKLREYLAAGLPVVSTSLPEVARYRALVHLAEGTAGFTQAIATALGERSPAADRARAAAMGAESWEARVAEIEGHIDRTARRGALAAPHPALSVAAP
ncbi:MAG TPA: glycosyltransferase [Verrucomicrobiae bacterium]|nr:glycosyltransferase [Verrucomicrobiae bacterium]